MTKRTIELPRATVALLIGGLVAALVGLAFLIGRETARPAAPDVTASTSSMPSSDAPSSAVTPQRDERPGGRSGSAPAAPPVETSTPAPPGGGTSAAPPPPTTPLSSATANPEREAVARYFRDVEAIETAGGGPGGDPQQMALAILTQGTQGDWSSFDKMSRDQRALLDRLQQVSVPVPCQPYHNRSVALMRDSIGMLESVKTGIQSGNVSALTTLTARAQKLQSEALDVQSLGESIKRQYGVR